MQENECTIATEMKWTEITRKIKEHTDKAISKHPKFADTITDTNNIEIRMANFIEREDHA